MRIIGGRLSGRKLATFSGRRIRPTADRIREAIFNILSTELADAHVLDLFSGTGALGLEALSRGAASTVFVERSVEALRLIRTNIRSCGLLSQTTVIQWDIMKNLNCIRKTAPPFDLIFLDPPYACGMLEPALINLSCSGAFHQNAVVVAEHGSEESFSDAAAAGFRLALKKIYGKKAVSFLRPAPCSPAGT